MGSPRREDRLYAVVVLTFLIGLVALGLLGVPAPLVAAIGAAVAAIGIGAFHGPLERRSGSASNRRRRRRPVPARYVPSVLEQSSVRRRRGLHLRRHGHA
ncbi:MAG TPA: hypothetical protein VHZ54_02860 [Solirubrobacterales bacterium]|jgi:hypothetical protein|nr:hypothetical protein [Solirubrobacterales bacterium]